MAHFYDNCLIFSSFDYEMAYDIDSRHNNLGLPFALVVFNSSVMVLNISNVAFFRASSIGASSKYRNIAVTTLSSFIPGR